MYSVASFCKLHSDLRDETRNCVKYSSGKEYISESFLMAFKKASTVSVAVACVVFFSMSKA